MRLLFESRGRTLMRFAAFALLVATFGMIAPTLATADGHAMAWSSDTADWAPLGEGPLEIKVLWGDPSDPEGTDFGALLKLPFGFTPGPHSHNAAYHGINVAGVWTHVFGDADVRSLPQGSYVNQPAGAEHNDACASADGCIIFIHQHGPMSFIPRESE